MSTTSARCRDHDLAIDDSGRCVLCRRDARAVAPVSELNGARLPLLPIVLASSFGLVFVGGLVLSAFLLAGSDEAMAADETPTEATADAPDTTSRPGTNAPGARDEHPARGQGHGNASAAPGGRGNGAKADVPIEVYSASWCPACRAAKRWLDQNGYQYTDYDIDHDAAARGRLRTLNPRGSIPVIVVDRDRTFVGFDPNALENAIDAAASH